MSQCENCANYYFDDESEEYCCDINLNQHEIMRFLTNKNYHCPYFRLDDEYGLVRKQN